MHVSNFRPVKRVKDVVRVFARVAERLPAVLMMVGDGPDRVDAEAEARNLGVQDSVFFLGKIDTVAPLLAGADLFLLPSSSESFGLSALEALGFGRSGDWYRYRGHPGGRTRTVRPACFARSATSRRWPMPRSRFCRIATGGRR